MAKYIQKINGSGFGIVVDDGSVKETILNKFGEEVGVFYFRPTDVGMVDRYNEIAEKFDKITQPLEQVDINPDGTTDGDDASMEAMREAENRLYEACDYLLGGNFSDAFFGKMKPFSPVNGRFYCEIAIEAVGQYISQQFDRETRKVNQRVLKYTQGYQPHGKKSGKHKGGKKK